MDGSIADIDRLIQSCYDEDDIKATEDIKDVGRQSRADSQRFFSSSATECTDNRDKIDSVLKKIALLIQRLGTGPLLEGSFNHRPNTVQRIRGLNCITGALLGYSDLCNDVHDSSTNSSITDLIDKIGRFVLLFCAPLQEDDDRAWNEDQLADSDQRQSIDHETLLPDREDIRDNAMDCSCALLKLPWIPQDHLSSDHSPLHQSKRDRDIKLTEQLQSILQIRIQIARQAVAYRCLSSDNDSIIEPWESELDSKKDNDGDDSTLSGLSLLVRARRSLCFSVLHSAVQGMTRDLLVYSKFKLNHGFISSKTVTQQNTTNTSRSKETTNKGPLLNPIVFEQVRSFISFISTCLLGETDPRCLMQMMTLLHQCQISFSPLFHETTPVLVHFPMVEVFDAVAPYYPIQFTPPPNNIHGITREGLHQALMSVLCFFDYSLVVDSTDDTMTNLGAKLFLERIYPTSPDLDDKAMNDSDSFNADSISGLEDLTQLMFNSLEIDIDSPTSQDSLVLPRPRFLYLAEDTWTILTSVLWNCHEKVSSIVGITMTQNDDLQGSNSNKVLATSCRNFVSRLAYALDSYRQRVNTRNDELTSKMDQKVKYIWRVFVTDVIASCMSTISSSLPSLKGRVSLAYLGSLAACGAIEILRIAVSSCIPVLIRMLSVDTRITPDYEQMSSAAYGIALLFSSSKTALDHNEKRGLTVCPHPLQSYVYDVATAVCKIIITERSTVDSSIINHRSRIILLQTACFKTLEALIITFPNSLSDESVASTIQQTLFCLTERIVDGSLSDESDAFDKALSQLMGRLIAQSLSTVQNCGESSVFLSAPLAQNVKDMFFPAIMGLVSSKTTIRSKIPRTILSAACALGSTNVSSTVIAQILDLLVISLRRHIGDNSSNDDELTCINLSKTISFILSDGGDATHFAFFHQYSMTVFHLIDILCKSDTEIDPQMSALLLPDMKVDLRLAVHRRMNFASKIISSLIPVYRYNVPLNHLLSLVSYTSKILPPLTEWDNLKLTLILPILEITLGQNKFDSVNNLLDMLPFLVEFCLNTESDPRTRTHALSIAFIIIESYSEKELICPVGTILTRIVFPDIVRCCELLSERGERGFDEFINVLFLVAIMGAAAAARGGDSLRTADEIGHFLVNLSFHIQPRTSAMSASFDICFQSIESVTSYTIQIAAARAYGLLLNWDDKKTSRRMAKQRLAYITLPTILSFGESTIPSDHLRALSIVGHIICNISITAFSLSEVDQITLLLLRGLDILASTTLLQHIMMSDDFSQQKDFEKWLSQLALSSLLKISIEAETSIINILPKLTSSLLLYCKSYSEVVDQSPNILLCLQLLMNIVHIENDEAMLSCNRLQDKVLLHLSCLLYSPSLQVRQAAVNVRNIWALLGTDQT